MEVDFEKLKFMPFRSFMGRIDDFLGVNMFWSEKFLLLVLYLERLALLTMFAVPWPYYYLQNSRYLYVFLLDFSAHQGGVDALGSGTIFDGCDATCKSIWGVFGIAVVVGWALVASWQRFSLYYTVNIERCLWNLSQVFFLPFCNVLVRYYMFSKEGRLYGDYTWSTPVSEIGAVFLVFLGACFFGIAYARMSRLVLFISPIRHESYLRSREVEYLLHFSPTYRNERVWMISHYTLEAWWWTLARHALDLALLLVLVLASDTVAIILAAVFIALQTFLLLFVISPHRCVSSNHLEICFNIGIFIYALLGVLQVEQVQSAILVDNVLTWLILGIECGCIFMAFVMSCWYFYDGHTFSWWPSEADNRAKRKWRMYFSPEALREQEESKMLSSMRQEIAVARDDKLAGKSDYNPYGMDEADIKLHSSGVKGEEEDFIKALRRVDAARLNDQMKAREADLNSALSQTERDARRQAEAMEESVIGVDAASPHTWPMNESIVSEMMRRNSTDHLIDYLRASRKLLDRIAILHNSPMLVPTDEIKMHISRLERSVQFCKLERITHHANIIHPLQPTFEELIEQLTYELRIFSKKSVTKGHNARKMIEVSRFLRIKMDTREDHLALLSPQMRRILLKMFALRIFIQLVFDRKESLLPKKYHAGDELRKQQRRSEKRKKRRRQTKREERKKLRQEAIARGESGDEYQDVDAFYSDSDASGGNSDDDSDDDSADDSSGDDIDINQKLHQYDDPFAAGGGGGRGNNDFGEGVDVLDAFGRTDDSDLTNAQDELNATHQRQLAEMLKANKNKNTSHGANSGAGARSAYDNNNNNQIFGARREESNNGNHNMMHGNANDDDDDDRSPVLQRKHTTVGSNFAGPPSAKPLYGDDDDDDEEDKKNR